VAAGDNDGELQMYFEREGSRVGRENEQTVSVQMTTTDKILRKHQWQPDFDLFISDTEDYELQVLQGFNLEYWLPKLSIVETHGHLRAAIHARFDPLYKTVHEDGLNTIFARRDWA
jgi:hypothetical protein